MVTNFNRKLYMTGYDLLQKLQEYSEDDLKSWQVVIFKDAEGNDCTPLAGVDSAWYRELNSYSGEIKDGEDLESNDKLVFLLQPTN